MWTFLITLLAVIAVALFLFAIACAVTRKRKHLAHEKLNREYIYRDEPHADQVTRDPNKLDDNEVTKG